MGTDVKKGVAFLATKILNSSYAGLTRVSMPTSRATCRAIECTVTAIVSPQSVSGLEPGRTSRRRNIIRHSVPFVAEAAGHVRCVAASVRGQYAAFDIAVEGAVRPAAHARNEFVLHGIVPMALASNYLIPVILRWPRSGPRRMRPRRRGAGASCSHCIHAPVCYYVHNRTQKYGSHALDNFHRPR